MHILTMTILIIYVYATEKKVDICLKHIYIGFFNNPINKILPSVSKERVK